MHKHCECETVIVNGSKRRVSVCTLCLLTAANAPATTRVKCVDCDTDAVTTGQRKGTPEGQRGPKCERHAGPAVIDDMPQTQDLTCQWFAMCTNPATAIKPHPVFPKGVPICGRCQVKARKD